MGNLIHNGVSDKYEIKPLFLGVVLILLTIRSVGLLSPLFCAFVTSVVFCNLFFNFKEIDNCVMVLYNYIAVYFNWKNLSYIRSEN